MVNERTRLGIVVVSTELLRQAMRLPDGTEILDVRAGDLNGAIEIKLSSPGLAPVAEGSVIPRYRPRFTTDGFLDWDG